MSEPILVLKGLDKMYSNGVHAVKAIDYSISEGRCYAFLGPNGAGKSTTIGMICGLCLPSAGVMEFQGKRVSEDPIRYRSSIGVVSQHANLEMDLTVVQNLIVHAKLYNIPKREYQKRIEELLMLARLSQKRKAQVRMLSGGMRRKVQIVRALLHDPKLLILDEPTVGLDPASRQAIWEMILGMQREGKTILFSTHYMEEAHLYAQSISIIHQGSIIKKGTAEHMIDELGRWCREEYRDSERSISFFANKEGAMRGYAADSEPERLVVRRTTLEDVFIHLTGEGLV